MQKYQITMMIQNNTSDFSMRETSRRVQQINSCNIHLNSSRNLSRFPRSRSPVRTNNDDAREEECPVKSRRAGRIEKFEIKCLKVRRVRRQRSVENNGTEGARGPIETTIYQRPLLSIIAPDGNADRTWKKVVLSVSRPRRSEISQASGTNG